MDKMTEVYGDGRLLRSINDFTNHLFQCIADDKKGNFVFSALNAHCALSMCLLGARGNTTEKMQKCLGLLENPYDLVDWKNLLESLENNIEGVDLSIKNQIFVNEYIKLKESFMNSLKRYFNSEVARINFYRPRNAVETINGYYARKTNGQIKNINKYDIISDNGNQMVLMGVVYFKALWHQQFDSRETTMEPFYIDGIQKQDVEMMKLRSVLFYKDLNDMNAVSVAIPYENDDFLFVIILPKKIYGLEQLEKKIGEIQINYSDYSRSEDKNLVNLMLPKFKIDTSLDLKCYLRRMGMTDAFTRNANFEGISERSISNHPLHINNFCQKAFIDVNEEGTEVPTFERVADETRGLFREDVKVKVNRPFLFKIIKPDHGITLFHGRVTNPVYDMLE